MSLNRYYLWNINAWLCYRSLITSHAKCHKLCWYVALLWHKTSTQKEQRAKQSNPGFHFKCKLCPRMSLKLQTSLSDDKHPVPLGDRWQWTHPVIPLQPFHALPSWWGQSYSTQLRGLSPRANYTGRGDPLRWPRDTPLPAKVGTNFADRRRPLCRAELLHRLSTDFHQEIYDTSYFISKYDSFTGILLYEPTLIF
jgi:hypothetical protein